MRRLKMRSGIPSAANLDYYTRRTRVHGRPAGTAFAVERSATSIALDIHFENGGMADQAIDRGERHGQTFPHSCRNWRARAPAISSSACRSRDASLLSKTPPAHSASLPPRLLHEIRRRQRRLVMLADNARIEEVEPQPLEKFMAALKTAWADGTPRPTEKCAPPKVRWWRSRKDPFANTWPEVRQWAEAVGTPVIVVDAACGHAELILE
jgi:hypothetical protein